MADILDINHTTASILWQCERLVRCKAGAHWLRPAWGGTGVGFESNLLMQNGQVAPDNASLVRRATEHAAQLNRPLANADYIRRRFRAG